MESKPEPTEKVEQKEELAELFDKACNISDNNNEETKKEEEAKKAESDDDF